MREPVVIPGLLNEVFEHYKTQNTHIGRFDRLSERNRAYWVNYGEQPRGAFLGTTRDHRQALTPPLLLTPREVKQYQLDLCILGKGLWGKCNELVRSRSADEIGLEEFSCALNIFFCLSMNY